MMKKWVYKNTSHSTVTDFSQNAEIPEIYAYLLLNRGIDNYDDTKKFVYPSINDVHNPFLLKDMDKAVNRIKQAIQSGEKIAVYGDYDVDGLTSSAIIKDALQCLGIGCTVYIPDRLNEGYGLNTDAIKKLAQEDINLIITVDTGITAVEEVEFGNSLGIDFVITDHHQLLDFLPKAVAVVNPHREDSEYPFRELAGVGVAFKLASALLSEQFEKKQIVMKYIDLVSLGTISDMVPLIGENRFYAKYGLKHMPSTQNIGIKQLIRYSGYEGKILDEIAVGFGLGPRINAAGRMGKAELALRLLTTDSENEASELAGMLCNINEQRKSIEQEIFLQAVEQIENSDETNKVLVVSGKNWHKGIMGIVASKIMDLYYRPVVLLSIDDEGVAHGSCRSVDDFDIFDALCRCDEFLIKYGGHAMAAGLTLNEENVNGFKIAINHLASILLSENSLVPKIEIDYEAEACEIDMELVEKITYFEPYGTNNPCPVFSMRDMMVINSAVTRDGKHLRLRCQNHGFYFYCIGFNMGHLSIKEGDRIDIAFNIKINEFNGKRDFNFIIKDIITYK